MKICIMGLPVPYATKNSPIIYHFLSYFNQVSNDRHISRFDYCFLNLTIFCSIPVMNNTRANKVWKFTTPPLVVRSGGESINFLENYEKFNKFQKGLLQTCEYANHYVDKIAAESNSDLDGNDNSVQTNPVPVEVSFRMNFTLSNNIKRKDDVLDMLKFAGCLKTSDILKKYYRSKKVYPAKFYVKSEDFSVTEENLLVFRKLEDYENFMKKENSESR